ncbi:MAG TPA: hypothetical protein VGD81_13450 [Opitutaceae bacterium]
MGETWVSTATGVPSSRVKVYSSCGDAGPGARERAVDGVIVMPEPVRPRLGTVIQRASGAALARSKASASMATTPWFSTKPTTAGNSLRMGTRME